MYIEFYISKNSGRCPVKEFIEKLEVRDKAKVLGCLKSIEELGFDTPRVQFRQIRGQLWEIKIKSVSGGFRIFFVVLQAHTLVLLHAYQKKSQKAPSKEVKIAEQRLFGVKSHEKNYIE